MQIATICGSIGQSLEDMRLLERQLTLLGRIVLFPVPVEAQDHDPFLDAIHHVRIGMAHEVWVVYKPDGTLGVSTAREMQYAVLLGKDVMVGSAAELAVTLDNAR